MCCKILLQDALSADRKYYTVGLYKNTKPNHYPNPIHPNSNYPRDTRTLAVKDDIQIPCHMWESVVQIELYHSLQTMHAGWCPLRPCSSPKMSIVGEVTW